MNARRGFASDNSATIHPDVLAAIARVNDGHAFGYGHDDYTPSVERRVADCFGPDSSAFFVFNGTGANVVALRTAAAGSRRVICPETAHINVDECGAPERFTGAKLLDVPTADGKLTPEHVDEPDLLGSATSTTSSRGWCRSRSRTEHGTLYTPDEIAALADVAHHHGLLLHLDGARLANAAAALGGDVRRSRSDVGVDVLTFGGTKNGMLYGEAVVFLDPELGQRVPFLRKQAMQLPSKMRFVAAQFEALLADDLWLRNATHANAMAQLLAERVADVAGRHDHASARGQRGVRHRPARGHGALQAWSHFYVWDEATTEVRWMCSWDTTEEDVDGFATAVHAALDV